ncbi:ABC-2 type transport system ATP-binding protein [Actinomyces ruminicola]|uniref:ABC-2 type transport system ATP-binding protein n=1 Tax=Actinomyces ruminicola TaxID=332524 RepID=A0A1H0FK18_9ACTO|nr:ABC transporter ATP-binding protein [Actinomyces ruminicola]SDN94954.1 ABC-2 type transport system ATP-binding protein [Actinomyces ruminicola]
MSAPALAVEMRDVRKSYNTPGGTIHAVDSMTLRAEPHRIHALLGPNGAGKTTSLEMIVGLRRPDQGVVRTLGLDPATAGRELSTRVAIQPQEAKIFERLRVGELMTLWSSFYTHPRPAEEVLDSLELTNYVNREVTKLSGGTRQRLNVALAMVANPELLILDEPSTGLDPRAREHLWSVLASWRDRGLTIVMSTHSMEEATALADSVFIIDHGSCASAGTPEELIRTLAGGPAVHFQIVRELDDADTARLRQLGELVINADRTGHLTTDRTDEALAVLAADGRCRDLRIQVPTLADAYFAATGNQLTSPEPAGV